MCDHYECREESKLAGMDIPSPEDFEKQYAKQRENMLNQGRSEDEILTVLNTQRLLDQAAISLVNLARAKALPEMDAVLDGLLAGTASANQQKRAGIKLVEYRKIISKLPPSLVKAVLAADNDTQFEAVEVAPPNNLKQKLMEIILGATAPDAFPDPTAPIMTKPKKDTIH